MGSKELKLSKLCLQLFLFFNVAIYAFGHFSKNLSVIASIRPLMILENFLVIVMVISVAFGLTKVHPVFNWWIGRLWGSDQKNAKNINALPLQTPYLRWAYGVVLLVALPSLAKIEEEVFRNGTHSWQDALWRSLLFGLVHCLVGVPLCAGLAISLAGLWFSYEYMQGGVANSTLHHTTYNFTLILILLIGMLLIKIFPEKEQVDQDPIT